MPRVDAHEIAVVTNYEQALVWLGAADNITDEFLVSMFMVKVSSWVNVSNTPQFNRQLNENEYSYLLLAVGR